MSRARGLPARTLEEVVGAVPYYRQSLLGAIDNCALAALFELEGHGYTNAAQARGIIFHRFAREVLRTLWRTGEQTLSTEEALQILYEVSLQRDVPAHEVVIVPMRERRYLRICALKMASTPFDCRRLVNVEDRLEAVLRYQRADGGYTSRTISGTPDAVLADPPGGAVVLDHKTAPSAPAEGKAPKGAPDEPVSPNATEEQAHWSGDHLRVSYEGYFQQRFYAFLLMRNFASLDRVTLREWYVMPDEVRNATVPRAALEHIEHELVVLCDFLDRALEGGTASELWTPSPGVHCSYCRRPTSCPIEPEARIAEGGITSDRQAAKLAGEVAVAEQVRKVGIPALKARHEATGRPIPVKDSKGRHEWRWGKDSAGKRRFKLHVPEASDRGPEDAELARAFALATERTANDASS